MYLVHTVPMKISPISAISNQDLNPRYFSGSDRSIRCTRRATLVVHTDEYTELEKAFFRIERFGKRPNITIS